MIDTNVNRLHELSRPSAEFPRRFLPETVNYNSWDDIRPYFEKLRDRKLDSVEAVEEWLLDVSELSSVVSEEYYRRYIAMTCSTEDAQAETNYLHFVENILPKLKPEADRLDRKLIENPHSKDLNRQRYGILLRSARNSIELFREENVPLETELEKLAQQYDKIAAGMTVDFQGKTRTLQQMGVFLEKNDRRLRQEAWELTANRRLEDAERLEDIFDEMLKLRAEIARNAGFDDYRAYMFRVKERFDYTPEDCLRFHDAVAEHVVPITREITRDRQQSLQVDAVRPWDTACDRLGREPLKPFSTTRELVENCRTIFHRVDEEFGSQFQQMVDLGLLDLDSRKGKAPGGYQENLPEVRFPFIFTNAVGINRDVFTLLHEGGHAFHAFAVRGEPLVAYRSAPMEFSEVASMAMEQLGSPHLDVFYSKADTARVRADDLEGRISFLPWCAIVDAFQHWIYTNPGHTREERSAFWLKLMDRFGSGVDYSGCEEARKYRWHAQLHIFEVPFYYIEYGIAELGALQIRRNHHLDPASAVRSYKNALRLGGSRPLPDLFSAADIRFDFSEAVILPIMEELQQDMADLRAHESR